LLSAEREAKLFRNEKILKNCKKETSEIEIFKYVALIGSE